MGDTTQADDWGIPLAPHAENRRVVRVLIGAGLMAFGLVAAELAASMHLI